MNLKTAAAIFFVFTCVNAFADYNADRLKETKSYLNDIKKQLDLERSQIDKIENTKESLALKVNNIADTMKLQETIIQNLSSDSEQLKKEVSALDKEISSISKEIEAIRDSIETGNIYLIDNIEFVNIRLLLFSRESRNTIKNMEILEKVNTVLMNRSSEIEKRNASLEAIKNQKETKSRDIDLLIRTKQRYIAEYDAEKLKLKQLVAVMEQDREQKRQYIKILNKKQLDFEKKLDRINKQIEENNKKDKISSGDDSLFGRLKGKMDWPTEGTIIEFFGPKKVEGFDGTIQNKGIKIAPSGHGDVRAVFDGTVRYIDNIRGFGNLLILGHQGGYYTLYANMDRINTETGANIVKGQAIGAVSVDQNQHTNYLYFEIRKNNQALNPSEWLKSDRR